LLSLAKLVDRLIEHNQREDVSLFEGRRARQDNPGPAERASDIRVCFNALNDPPRPDVKARIELVQPHELHRSIAENLETAALKVVRPPDGLDGAVQTDDIARLFLDKEIAAERHVHRSEPDGRVGTGP